MQGIENYLVTMIIVLVYTEFAFYVIEGLCRAANIRIKLVAERKAARKIGR